MLAGGAAAAAGLVDLELQRPLFDFWCYLLIKLKIKNLFPDRRRYTHTRAHTHTHTHTHTTIDIQTYKYVFHLDKDKYINTHFKEKCYSLSCEKKFRRSWHEIENC